MREFVKVFSPATVANVGCGFDVVGFSFSAVGDVVSFRKIDEPGVFIKAVRGKYEIPGDPEKNTITIPILKVMEDKNVDFGVEVEIEKNIPVAGGLGSSAAGAVAGAVGINYLLGNILDDNKILEYALVAEEKVSGGRHADNIAPCFYGGFVIVRDVFSMEVVRIPFPEDLFCVVIHPHVSLRTEDSRKVLPEKIFLGDVVKQMAHLSCFISGLLLGRKDLLSAVNFDCVAEPVRSRLIPEYRMIKEVALEAGAIGCNISGSGPSVFAFVEGERETEHVGKEMGSVWDRIGLEYDLYVGKVSEQGVRLIEE